MTDDDLDRRRAELAAGWANVAGLQRRQKRLYGPAGTVLTFGLMLAVVAVMLVPAYLETSHVVAPDTLDWLAPTIVLGSMAVGGAIYVTWYIAAGRPWPGAVPDLSDVDATTIDAAERRLRLARHAEPRLDYVRALKRSRFGTLELVIIGVLVVPPTAIAVLYTVPMLVGDEPSEPVVWFAWPVAAVGVGLVVLARRRRRRRKSAVDEAVGGVAGLRPLPTVADKFGWLNRYWAAESEPDDYYSGPRHTAAAGTIEGFPVLMDVEPDGLSDESTTFHPQVVVFVAAMWAASYRPSTSERAASLRASIGDRGFTPTVDADAGLVARASLPTVRRIHDEPDRLAAFGPLMHDVVALAIEEGAIPVPP